ncbi:hypothetical protein BLOT_005883 [Blomia tropicalis]|nr:hypothetical protein BLOT_005883 [Blomia tropicalis]
MLQPNFGGSSSLHFAYCISQFGYKSFVNTKPTLGSAATDRRITAGFSKSMEMRRYFHPNQHRAVPRLVCQKIKREQTKSGQINRLTDCNVNNAASRSLPVC